MCPTRSLVRSGYLLLKSLQMNGVPFLVQPFTPPRITLRSDAYAGKSARVSISRMGLAVRFSHMTSWTTFASPVGELTVLAGAAGVRGVYFPRCAPVLDAASRREIPAVTGQLEEYFAGGRRRFEVDLDLAGTPLQRAVWARLLEIPYGSTTTYGELADSIDESLFPSGLIRYQRVRVAAAAIGRTPAPILVPCHRVIGADGSLTGYGGGLERKRFLLDLEGRVAAGLSSAEPAPAHCQLAMM